jgi:hypothetical protein
MKKGRRRLYILQLPKNFRKYQINEGGARNEEYSSRKESGNGSRKSEIDLQEKCNSFAVASDKLLIIRKLYLIYVVI